MLIIGLPNAGKTTYSQRFKNVLHYDEIMILPKEERYELYRKAEIIEGIFNTRKSREIVLSLWTDKKRKTCIWIDTPVDVCREREDRCRPTAIVAIHAKRFEPPTFEEGWDEIIIVDGG